MGYSWKIADISEYPSFLRLVIPFKWGVDYITRRLVIPLSLGHLIGFYDDTGAPAGFLTLAFLSRDAEAHQPDRGILPGDWRSGLNFWVVDMIAPHGGCPSMLRTIIKSLDPNIIKSARYFREKYRQIREVKPV